MRSNNGLERPQICAPNPGGGEWTRYNAIPEMAKKLNIQRCTYSRGRYLFQMILLTLPVRSVVNFRSREKYETLKQCFYLSANLR